TPPNAACFLPNRVSASRHPLTRIVHKDIPHKTHISSSRSTPTIVRSSYLVHYYVDFFPKYPCVFLLLPVAVIHSDRLYHHSSPIANTRTALSNVSLLIWLGDCLKTSAIVCITSTM